MLYTDNEFLKIFTKPKELIVWVRELYDLFKDNIDQSVKTTDDVQFKSITVDEIILTSGGVIGGTEIVGEVPSGAIDGVNTVFTTAHNFIPSTLKLYLNGLRDNSFSVIGPNQFQLIGFIPLPGNLTAAPDDLRVDYRELTS